MEGGPSLWVTETDLWATWQMQESGGQEDRAHPLASHFIGLRNPTSFCTFPKNTAQGVFRLKFATDITVVFPHVYTHTHYGDIKH